MGRRALRKIDPALDLSRVFYPLDDVPRPFAFAPLFDTPGPLEVEIGTGKGLFLSNAAAAAPTHRFVGIEVARKYAMSAAARLARRGLTNARVVHGDGLRFFHEWLPDHSVAAVHVYFPDPWWKKRHRKRRVMNEAFLSDIQRVLTPGGRLHFWTDVEEYFTSTLELIQKTVKLVGPIAVPERPALDDLDYRTHFERRMRLHREAVYRSEFVAPDEPSAGD
jgi:tRNA (guanine-N7-)-methyltransferase